jgi:hypothetical protein
MRSRACVADREATVLMLVSTDARVRNCAVRLVELSGRDVRNRRPECLCRAEVESLVEIEPSTQALLVDVEEAAEPCAEEPHHFRVAVREPNFPVGLRTLARVQSNTGDEERLITQRADALPSLAVQLVDLTELCFVRGMRAPVRAAQSECRCERASRTQRETDDFDTPRICAMSASVRFCARKARAFSCSSTLPR